MKAKVLVNTLNMDKETWKQYRKMGIGGSDVGSICGINPYSSPIKVYLDKIGEGIEVEENEKMHFGTILEQIVADEFTLRTGKKVKRRNAMLQHPEYPFMLANVDREVVGENSLLECKTASAHLEKVWEQGIPESYQLQVYHYMAVGGYDRAYVACLIGGNHFVYYTLERDEEIISSIIAIEQDFWSKVQTHCPPAIDGSEASTDVLNAIYRKADESKPVVQLESGIENIIEERELLKKQEKEIQEKINFADNTLKSLIGEAEAAETSNFVVTWKNVSGKSGIDSKKLKVEMPEVYKKYFKQGNGYRTLKINRKVE